MKKSNPSISSFEAKKQYTEMEIERIRHKISCFGSEGLCPHCKFSSLCEYSTITFRIGCSRLAYDGIAFAVTHDETFKTKMKYKFEIDEYKSSEWWFKDWEPQSK